MMQRTCKHKADPHVGIIMDGNGRWAHQRGLARSAGHRQGAKAVRRTAECAVELGIPVLTLFAFSADNWQRPPSEVGSLMYLLEKYLEREQRDLAANGVRLDVIGRRDRLRPALANSIARAETATSAGSSLLLRVAIDYSARHAIAAASQLEPRRDANPTEDFARRLDRVIHATVRAPALDLIIRTGGEHRLSDFMLWESAYAELAFLPTLWPDFDRQHFQTVIADFRGRDRRFGRLPARAS